MQPLARSGLTDTQVMAFIRDTPALQISAGLELLNINLIVIEDITSDFAGGTVSRGSYQTLHGSGDFLISRDLNWANAIIRPYMILQDGITSIRVNLGAYLTSSPETVAGETPKTHAVQGYDILHWLNTPVGDAFTVTAGSSYLGAAENILIAQGIKRYQIDQTQASKVLPHNMIWPLDGQTTWLNIINQLITGVGYQGVWSDWDGNIRLTPYELPSQRITEWVYDTDVITSMLGLQRTMIRDWFDAPNRWVFYWAKDPTTNAPIEGAGLYTFVNNNNGPSSVSERGRTITAPPVQLDVVDQSSLINAAQRTIDSDLRLKTTYRVTTAPNPMHWHFDKITYDDPELTALSDVLVSKWTLPLNGDDMTHEWSLL